MEETEAKEPKIRLNIKKNFKGEMAYEYTVRGETPQEIEVLKQQVKIIAEAEVKNANI